MKNKFLITAAILICFSLAACSYTPNTGTQSGTNIENQTDEQTESNTETVSIPSYTITSQQDYIREGKPCQGYRIITEPSVVTNDEILAVYNDITSSSEYLYHTLWFYEVSEEDLPYATLDDEIMDGDTPSISRTE